MGKSQVIGRFRENGKYSKPQCIVYNTAGVLEAFCQKKAINWEAHPPYYTYPLFLREKYRANMICRHGEERQKFQAKGCHFAIPSFRQAAERFSCRHSADSLKYCRIFS